MSSPRNGKWTKNRFSCLWARQSLKSHFAILSIKTSWIKLLHMMDGACSELTKRRIAVGWGEVDFVFITLMLELTQSKLMDIISQMLNLLIWGVNHIIITILLLLFTYTVTQIQKYNTCLFIFVYSTITEYMFFNLCCMMMHALPCPLYVKKNMNRIFLSQC